MKFASIRGANRDDARVVSFVLNRRILFFIYGDSLSSAAAHPAKNLASLVFASRVRLCSGEDELHLQDNHFYVKSERVESKENRGLLWLLSLAHRQKMAIVKRTVYLRKHAVLGDDLKTMFALLYA